MVYIIQTYVQQQSINNSCYFLQPFTCQRAFNYKSPCAPTCVLFVLQNNSWIGRAWTNNNAESYYHVLKSKNDWKRLRNATALVHNVKALVQLQIEELERSLCGDDNFMLTGPFLKHKVTYEAWVGYTDDRHMDVFRKFLADTGNRQPPATITSSDGALAVLNTTKVARKPGQRKRPRATKMTSAPH